MTGTYVVNKKLIAPRLEEEKRQEIAKNLERCKTSDDIVATIFSLVQTERIPLDVRRIHTAIHELKKKYPEMLTKFTFSQKDVYPFSRLLERVLFRLQNSSLISTVNPDFKICIVSKESKEYVHKNIQPSFSDDEQEKLKQMAKMFERLVTESS